MKVSWYSDLELPTPVPGDPITAGEPSEPVGQVTDVRRIAGVGYLVHGDIADGALIGGPAQQVFSVVGDAGPRRRTVRARRDRADA